MTSLLRTSFAAATMLAAAAGSAHAVSIVDALSANPGDVIFKFGGFTAPTTSATGTNGGGAYDHSSFAGNETTFGFGTLAAVTNLPQTTNYWSNGESDQRVSFFLYGITDGNITSGGSNGNNIYNIGCSGGDCDGLIHVDFYLESASGDTNDDNTTLNPADRTGFASLPGITDEGSLLMRWTLDPGIVSADVPGGTDPTFDETQTTLFQDVSSQTLPATGDGNFYASCVDGPACAFLNSNNFNNSISDLFGQFTLTDAIALGMGGTWPGRISDPVQGLTTTPVPEPSTILLLGVGTLALGAGSGIRRRRKTS